MLDFLWPARHEPGFDAKPSSLHTPAATFLTRPPVPKELKRKRGQSSNAISPNLSNLECVVDTPIHSQNAVADRGGVFAIPPTTNQSKAATCLGSKEGSTVMPAQRACANTYLPETADRAAILQDTLPTHEIQNCMDEPLCGSLNAARGLRDTVETQFSLEILIKNRELRLIEQELAKCQVAYEQIRRCQVIPFPSQSSSGIDMLSVSNGAGLSFNNPAPSSSPWGVTEGPYSRHYQSWLITDSAFDSTFVEESNTQPVAGKRLPDRHTRGVHAEKGTFGGQSRSQRLSMSTRITIQPHDRLDNRVEKGPMIVARKSDGHMVKLICLDCRRSDFNSVQGFINHCRIAHSRQFVSHEAAIEASGEEVDGDKITGLVADAAATPRPSATAGLVHPMIRAARPPSPKPVMPLTPPIVVPLQSSASDVTATTHRSNRSVHSVTLPEVSPAFTPSPDTPYLSALLSRLGRNDNLKESVVDAKRTDEIDLIESMDMVDSEAEDVGDTEESAPHSRSTRGVVQSSFRPVTSGDARPATLPSVVPPTENVDHRSSSRDLAFERVNWSPPSVDTGSLSYGIHDGPTSDMASPSANLSPGVTDPNPAPSLVSDDGDYDHLQSDSDSSNHSDSDADGDNFAQPHLLDDEGMDLDDHSHFGFTVSEKPHGPGIRRRRRSSKNGRETGRRHVTFANEANAGGNGGIEFATR